MTKDGKKEIDTPVADRPDTDELGPIALQVVTTHLLNLTIPCNPRDEDSKLRAALTEAVKDTAIAKEQALAHQGYGGGVTPSR